MKLFDRKVAVVVVAVYIMYKTDDRLYIIHNKTRFMCVPKLDDQGLFENRHHVTDSENNICNHSSIHVPMLIEGASESMLLSYFLLHKNPNLPPTGVAGSYCFSFDPFSHLSKRPM